MFALLWYIAILWTLRASIAGCCLLKPGNCCAANGNTAQWERYTTSPGGSWPAAASNIIRLGHFAKHLLVVSLYDLCKIRKRSVSINWQKHKVKEGLETWRESDYYVGQWGECWNLREHSTIWYSRPIFYCSLIVVKFINDFPFSRLPLMLSDQVLGVRLISPLKPCAFIFRSDWSLENRNGAIDSNRDPGTFWLYKCM